MVLIKDYREVRHQLG